MCQWLEEMFLSGGVSCRRSFFRNRDGNMDSGLQERELSQGTFQMFLACAHSSEDLLREVGIWEVGLYWQE